MQEKFSKIRKRSVRHSERNPEQNAFTRSFYNTCSDVGKISTHTGAAVLQGAAGTTLVGAAVVGSVLYIGTGGKSFKGGASTALRAGGGHLKEATKETVTTAMYTTFTPINMVAPLFLAGTDHIEKKRRKKKNKTIFNDINANTLDSGYNLNYNYTSPYAASSYSSDPYSDFTSKNNTQFYPDVPLEKQQRLHSSSSSGEKFNYWSNKSPQPRQNNTNPSMNLFETRYDKKKNEQPSFNIVR